MSIGHAEMAANTPRRRVRLLSLDGGGIRGVSMITILKEIMRQVNQGRPGNEQLQPWQVFDLIGGTSTGGIIAIMLGCLRMTLDECEEAYKTLAQEIFRPKRSRMNPLRMIEYYQASERFDSQAMSNLLKDIIYRRTGSQNYLLRQAEELQSSCKVFVTTVRADDQELCMLRSYTNPRQTDKVSAKWELWEALRATSAANTYFDAHLNEGVRYVDGALKNNNPVYSVMAEADDLWNTPDSVMLSIGTGEKNPTPIGGNMLDLARTLTKTLVSDADTERFFRRSHRRMAEQGLLYRFNVPELGRVKLHDYKAIPTVIHNTQRYLDSSLVQGEVARCVYAIRHDSNSTAGPKPPGPMRITQLNQEEKGCLQSLHAIAGNYEGHRVTIDQPVPRTCEWFLAHKNFTEWIEDPSSSLLWLTANPGCGKSVLSSFLIDSLKQRMPEAAICYFFFQQEANGRSESHQAICALLHQLLIRFPDGVKAVTEAFSTKAFDLTSRNVEELWKLFKAVTQMAKAPQVIFVVDALDECSENSRNRFIDLLSSSFSQNCSQGTLPGLVRIFVTSRPWPVIERRFGQLKAARLRGEDEVQISHEIRTIIDYKTQELVDGGLISSEARSLVEDKLLSGADQTFLWVSLVLGQISRLQSRTLKSIKKSLESTPTRLDQLYESALSLLEQEEASLKLLRLIVAAKRPLHLNELNIVMNIDQDTESLESLRENLEPNMEHTAKQLGGFFIRIIDSKVHLVHLTAREFLLQSTSHTLPESLKGSILCNAGEAELSEACVTFLTLKGIPQRALLPSKNEDVPSLRERYLLELSEWARQFFLYASMYWGESPGIEQAMAKYDHVKDRITALCDPKGPLLASWWLFYIFNVYGLWRTSFLNEDPCFTHMTTCRGHLIITKQFIANEACLATDTDAAGCDILFYAVKYHQWEHVKWLLAEFSDSALQFGPALIQGIFASDSRFILSLIDAGTNLNIAYKYEGRMLLPGERAVLVLERLRLLLLHGLKVVDALYNAAVYFDMAEAIAILFQHDDRNTNPTNMKHILNRTYTTAMSLGYLDCVDVVISIAGDLITEPCNASAGLGAVIFRGDMETLHRLLELGADASDALREAAGHFNTTAAEILFRHYEYSSTQTNDALAYYFDKHVGPELEDYVIQKIHRIIGSSDRTMRLYNAFTIVPCFGGLPDKRNRFFDMFLSQGGCISAQLFASATSLAIAFDETFAMFLLEKSGVLQTNQVLQPTDFLTTACLWGKPKVVRKILSYDSIGVNRPDPLGMTAMFAAVASGNPEVVSILLEQGARFDESVICKSKPQTDGEEAVTKLTIIPSNFIESLGKNTKLSARELACLLGYDDMTRLLSATG